MNFTADTLKGGRELFTKVPRPTGAPVKLPDPGIGRTWHAPVRDAAKVVDRGGKNLPFSYLFFVSVSLCWEVLYHVRWGGVPWMDSVGMVRLSNSVITV